MAEFTTIEEVAEFPSGKNGSIKVRVVQINGNRFALDIRKWVEGERYTGPTKSGIMLDWDAVNKFFNKGIIDDGLVALDRAMHPEEFKRLNKGKKKKTTTTKKKKTTKRSPTK